MQFGQLFLYQLFVPVELRARGQELLDFRSILNTTDWPILESSQLLVLELADAVFQQLDLQVFLHYLLPLRLLQMHVLVLGRSHGEAQLLSHLTAVVVGRRDAFIQLLDSIFEPNLFLSELLAHLRQELLR